MTRLTIAVRIVAIWLIGHAATGGAVVTAQGLTVAAASDLQTVLPSIAERFQREMGVPVRVTFGSSGNFFSQIQNGAPFDVFLSADVDYPQRLIADGTAMKATLSEYATGQIVIWARKDSGVDVQRGMTALTDARVRRIAIANPEHAPYGRAAVAALQHDKLYDTVKGKLVLGENISQAAQFVQSGNAEAGIIALSIALSPELAATGAYSAIPPSAHPPIRQAAVVLSASQNQTAAAQFVAFLTRPETRELFRQFGFTPSGAP